MTPTFRYQTYRLVRDGQKMVERGYRQLLRARGVISDECRRSRYPLTCAVSKPTPTLNPEKNGGFAPDLGRLWRPHAPAKADVARAEGMSDVAP